jgi:hypothetical protein
MSDMNLQLKAAQSFFLMMVCLLYSNHLYLHRDPAHTRLPNSLHRSPNMAILVPGFLRYSFRLVKHSALSISILCSPLEVTESYIWS